MNFYLLALYLILLISINKASPLGNDDDENGGLARPTRRSTSDEESFTTTHPTFTVQRLDAPIERIEIVLIDNNATYAVSDATVSPVKESEEDTSQERREKTEDVASTEPPTEHVHEPDQDPSPAPANPTSSNDEMYKKIEYVVQPTSMEATSISTSNDHSNEPIVIGVDPSYYSAPPSDKEVNAEIQAKAWISVSTSIPKFEGDIDEDDLPPPPASVDTETEEPEEECLANKDKLSEEVIEKLRAETTMYYKLVRQRNEQQKEYCGGGAARDTSSNMYRRCSNWRAEKLVYYYKLMRKTYCQVDNWPNSPKIKKTYGEYLNLFGAFYAFQK